MTFLTIDNLTVRKPYVVAMEFLPEGIQPWSAPMARLYLTKQDETLSSLVAFCTKGEFDQALKEWMEE